jgi:serine protease Do
VAARPPDWLIYLGVVGILIGAAVLGQRGGGRPARRPAAAPVSPKANPAPPPVSTFNSTITVDVPAVSGPGEGTAFSVSSGGVWLTARHVVEGCRRTVIVVGPGQGVSVEVRIDPRGETAVLITQGGAPALPMAPRDSLRPGMMGFAAGFPHGRPGEVASRLVRTETLVLRGRRIRREAVLDWAETDDEGPVPRSLAGLSGAPVLDTEGRVIGVTIAQSRRHARLYTTRPAALRTALDRAHIEPATGAEAAPMSSGSYGFISASLRRELRIVPVVCLAN